MSESDIVTQQLALEQIPSVVQQEQQATDFPWTEGMYADSLRAGYWVGVMSRNERVGGLAVVTSAVGEAHLLNMWVDVGQQGQGLGRQLLLAACRHAADTEATKMFLEVRAGNGRARNLYQSAGFAEIGLRKDYYPGALAREDAVCMALDLLQTLRED